MTATMTADSLAAIRIDRRLSVSLPMSRTALRERKEMDEPSIMVAMRQMSEVWENLFPIEQNRIMRLLIERVQLHEDGLDIIWRDDSWQRFCRELERHPFVAEQRAPVEIEVVE